MNSMTYDRLDQSVFRGTLPNGLRICVIPKPGFSRKYAFFAANYGSIDTCFTLDGVRMRSPEGVAHYLEHKMFDTEDGNALQTMSSTGASPNAFTSYQMTAYYFECTDAFEENLRTLLSFVATPYFTPESVEKEQGIITQEIRMYEDHPPTQLGENLFRAMYRNHPLRSSIAGTVESIAEITPQILYDCHRGFYDPSDMVLCVAADVDPQRVEEIALELLPGQAGGVSGRDYGPAEPLAPAQREIRREMEVAMPMFAIGFKCPPVPEGPERLRQELVGDLAAEVLCGESSPLYQTLYEDGLIDSGFSVGYEILRGMPNLSVSGDSTDPDAVLAAVLRESERIAREGVDRSLFERLVRSLRGHRIRGIDGFDGLCCRMASGMFDGYDYFTFPEEYDTITPEEIQQFLGAHVTEAQTVLSVISPAQKGE